ncbi:oligopeptide ABC transporter permease OppB [Spiroplasma tabanidicola]|uniref:Oligopeptide ABC transporter permease n=1 Tax=Spiroplasma tabanidicola TaxID=324079 RepID=A0A6I6C9L7_9MOLU|nr:oligopeptide ABC transporter permease OppB [Spiroplasma tabanidicola]QGS52149.1 oligopeptide ABC transporter permease [Spiroplasma tabanidicola]
MKNDLTSQNELIEQDLQSVFDRIELKDEIGKTKVPIYKKLGYLYAKFNSGRREFLAKTPLLSYSVKRILYAFLTFYLAVAVVYVLMVAFLKDDALLSDYDPIKNPIKPNTPEFYDLIENKRKAFGLYGSMIKQVLIFWRNITPFIPKTIMEVTKVSSTGVYGNETKKWFWLGMIMNGTNGNLYNSVLDTFKDAMPISFILGFSSTIITYLIGVPMGIVMARFKEKPLDNSLNWIFLGFTAVPSVIIVSIYWTVTVKYFNSAGVWDMNDYTKFVAIFALVILGVPGLSIITRRFIIDEMTADYTKFAQSKGLSNSYVFYIHIFRNAGIRIIRTIPASIIYSLFGSSILVEQFYVAPGMSKYILKGVGTNDIYIVLGYIVLSAGIGIFVSLLSDLLMAVLDPRVKLSKK